MLRRLGRPGATGQRLLHRSDAHRRLTHVHQGDRVPCTATPTIAQSIARLVNFWNDQPRAAGLGRRISVINSPGAVTVVEAEGQ
jgi:hypothetical protein